MPQKFIAKPVAVEAMQFTETSWQEVNRWLAAEYGSERFYFLHSGDTISLHISTREGPRDCDPGYWIVKGTQGEFYPVPAEVFAVKYVTEDDYAEIRAILDRLERATS